MNAAPVNTIAALCYARETNLDFHRIATDLSRAIWDIEGGGRLDMPAANVAVCDSPDTRIALAHVSLSRSFPGSLAGKHYPTCLVLSVGPGEATSDTTMAHRSGRVRAELVSRLQDIVTADRVLMFDRDGPFDPHLHEHLIDDIRGHLDTMLCPRRAPVSDVTQAAPVRRPAQVSQVGSAACATVAVPASVTALARAVDTTEPDEIMHGLAGRLETELDRLQKTREALEAIGATPARRPPPVPLRMRTVVPRLFSGLSPSRLGRFRLPGMTVATKNPTASDQAYPDDQSVPANTDERPLVHRAAVNALNVTVMTFALPVGAALLTMAILGREDMLLSSRVTAVTGVGVGLQNTGFAQAVFSLFS